ncbi:MAG: hypothetical protein VXZ53_14275, partial [Planctomycetota bacterium]|nr:hypothetical protein [Planctomycetota bacterium]
DRVWTTDVKKKLKSSLIVRELRCRIIRATHLARQQRPPHCSEINSVGLFWRCRHEIDRYTTSFDAALQDPDGVPASHKMQHTHPLEG